jgi:hypothetical protein
VKYDGARKRVNIKERGKIKGKQKLTRREIKTKGRTQIKNFAWGVNFSVSRTRKKI